MVPKGPDSDLRLHIGESLDSGVARSLSSGRALRGPVGASRNDVVWGNNDCRCRQCFVSETSETSRIASANGNSSTISPSSSVTSRIAFKRSPSTPSVFSSSRIIARAISQARSGSRSSSPSGSEINSSPIRVLKKYRGIGRNPFRLRGPVEEPAAPHKLFIRNSLRRVERNSASGLTQATLNLLISHWFDASPQRKRELLLQCSIEYRGL